MEIEIELKKLYKKEIELIRKTTIPIIGICFGFEVIAEVFGEKLTKEKYIDSGLRKINFRHQNYSVWHNHYFALEKLNKNSKLQPLSYSQEGIQIYKVKDKNIFGLQFHPEHTEHKNDGSEIFQRILEKI
jgi:carbamoyl-phosphate synthase small subunit